MTTVAVTITVVVVAAVADEGVEAAGMKGMMMEEGVGTVAALRGVQEAPSGRTARSAGPRLSSGIVKRRESKDENIIVCVFAVRF
jgi:hypothetical protein